MMPPSPSSYGILASLSLVTMAAMSSVLSPENATAVSAPWPIVLTKNSSTTRAAPTTPKPMRWARLRPDQMRWMGWSTGCRVSMAEVSSQKSDAHPHDFLVGVDQLVADLKRHREAET